jgi:hypothetical protein
MCNPYSSNVRFVQVTDHSILKYLLGSRVFSSTVIKCSVGSVMRILWISLILSIFQFEVFTDALGHRFDCSENIFIDGDISTYTLSLVEHCLYLY